MGKQFPTITSPLKIGTSVLKSRLCSSVALPHYLQGPETFPTTSIREFYSSVARNGAAYIAIDESFGTPESRLHTGSLADHVHMPMYDTRDPAVHNSLSAMVNEIHFWGTKVLLKTDLEYPPGYSLHGGPVFNFLAGTTEDTKPVTEPIMEQMITHFTKKMQFYHSLGYDGLSMRTDHAMDPGDHPRRDEYGGSVPNRTRLLHRCLESVKQSMGPDFIIEAVMAGELPLGYGGDFDSPRDSHGNKIRSKRPKGAYSLADTIEFLNFFEGIIDIVQLREKDAFLAQPTTYNFKNTHESIRFSREIKAAGCKVLTAPNGGFQEPHLMEAALSSGDCDLISMGRGFYVDPDYYQKICEDRPEDITPCLRCGKCHGTVSAPWISFCTVNPKLGIQDRLPFLVKPPARRKKVAVIGGGPAGLNAALTAAQRGHETVLFEQSNRLGGQLNHAEYFSFKWLLKDYRDWLIRQCKKHHVTFCLNCRPSPEEIQAAEFDALLAATGSVHIYPKIPGIDGANGLPRLRTCYEVIGAEETVGRSVIIVGGSETGVESGMYLAEHGHDVTILTRQDVLAKDAPPLHHLTMDHNGFDKDGYIHTFASWENYDNLTSICNAQTVRVSPTTVEYLLPDGTRHTATADEVLINGGVRPLVDEALLYAGCTAEFGMIGDCNHMKNMQAGIRDAFAKASQL